MNVANQFEALGVRPERQRGGCAAAAGNHATAGNYYLRAANYYYCGERMIEPGMLEQRIRQLDASRYPVDHISSWAARRAAEAAKS